MRNNRRIYFVFLVVVALIAASFLYRIFIGVLVVLLLIINRDIIFRIVRHLKKIFQQNKLKAIGLSVIYFFAFTPFLLFLLIRTSINAINIKNDINSDPGQLSSDEKIKLDHILKIKNKLDS